MKAFFLQEIENNVQCEIVISPNFLVWKFCGKAQCPHRPKLYGNCAFSQISTP